MDADWLLVDDSAADRVEKRLLRHYFRTPVQIRGMSDFHSVLYLSEDAFGEFFTGREPEFRPEEETLRLDLEGGKLPAKDEKGEKQ
jgi:hypothetical protein